MNHLDTSEKRSPEINGWPSTRVLETAPFGFQSDPQKNTHFALVNGSFKLFRYCIWFSQEALIMRECRIDSLNQHSTASFQGPICLSPAVIKVYQKKSTNVFHTGSSKSFQNASAPNHLEILQSPSIHTPRPRMAFRRWHRWSLLRSPAGPRDPHHGSNGAWDTSRCIEVSEASRGANRNWRSPGRYFWLVVSTPVKNTS